MFSSTTIWHFYSPVSIPKSYVLQRSVNCAVYTSSHFLGLAGPQDLGSPLDQQPEFSIRCRTGIMRRVTWRRLPPTSLVLTLTRRPDTGERGQGMKKSVRANTTWAFERSSFSIWFRCRFIQEVGKALGLRHDTMATAAVYFHRSFFRKSLLQ